MKKVAVVSVLDQRLTVRSDADEEEIQKVGAFVNRRIREIRDRAPKASAMDVALLACMNIADDFLKERVERRKAAEKVKEILSRLDSAVL